MSRVISFVGESNSGKTSAIQEMIKLSKENDKTLAVIKSARNGFDVDIEGKDSDKYRKSGTDTVAISSGTNSIIFNNQPLNIKNFIFTQLYKLDFIILEGFKSESSFDKVLFVKDRASISYEYPKEIKALYCKNPSGSIIDDLKQFDLALPVFTWETINGLWELINEIEEDSLSLFVNDESIFLNRFVSNILRGTVMNFVNQLKVTQDVKEIKIFWDKVIERRNPRLSVNGKLIPMNKFVKSMLEGLILGMVSPLKLSVKDISKIEIDY